MGVPVQMVLTCSVMVSIGQFHQATRSSLATPGMMTASRPIHTSLPITVSPREGTRGRNSAVFSNHVPPKMKNGKAVEPSCGWLADDMMNCAPMAMAQNLPMISFSSPWVVLLGRGRDAAQQRQGIGRRRARLGVVDDKHLSVRPRDVELLAVERQVADTVGATAGQVAIAWVAARGRRLGTPVVPIPGTKRVKWLEQNAAALDIELTAGDLAALDGLAGKVVGARY